MALARHRTAPHPIDAEQHPAWDPTADPTLTTLLDHLAVELAHEYVRLMERAAQESPSVPTPTRQEA
jgi:hypothetical protein